MGDHADLDPHPGGRFAVNINGVAVRGTYLEIDPPHRLRITWGYAGGSPLPPKASTVEIRLLTEGPGTRVSLEHRDLPPNRPPATSSAGDTTSSASPTPPCRNRSQRKTSPLTRTRSDEGVTSRER